MTLNRTLLYSGPVEAILIGSEYIYETLDGVNISLETEFVDLHTDQIPGPTKKKKMNYAITISFKVPQLNFYHFKFAFGQPDANESGEYFYINKDERANVSVAISIPWVSGRIKTFVFEECAYLGATGVSLKKGEQSAFEVKFQALYKVASQRWGYARQIT